MTETTETNDMTAADIEKRLSEIGNERTETQTEAQTENTTQDTTSETPSVNASAEESAEEVEDRGYTNSDLVEVKQQLADINKKLASEGKPEISTDVTLEMLSQDPIGTIRKISEMRAREIAREMYEPFYKEQMVAKSDAAWEKFSNTLKTSGIDITPDVNKALVEAINALPPRSELVKIDPKFNNPEEVLELAYFNARKRIRPATQKVAPKSVHVEGANRTKNTQPNLDPNKMSLKDLEKKIGFAEKDY